MYDYKYLIEFPITISALPADTQVEIGLEGYAFSMSARLDVFELRC